jgi:glycosyltransferase involved in cell wall biosynthesis
VSTPLVLVDLLFFTGKKGGMESYVREVYSRLPRHGALRFVALASRELAAGDTTWFPGEIIDSGISGEDRVAWAWGELVAVGRWARKLKADLVHCPANLGPVRVGWLRSRVPVVLTVHDLLPFRHPEYVPGAYALVLKALIRLAARNARRVVTISRASETDIVNFLHVPAAHIDVVPLAGEPQRHTTGPMRRQDKLLLSVGNRMPHKNFVTLLTALALIPEPNRPHLVVTGSHGADPLLAVVRELNLENQVSLRGWLSADDLDRLYAESSLFVFPTRFEGFGLPALEAMARGCPVLCSDIPVLHEVAGTAAVFVDSTSSAALAAAITELTASPERLTTLAEAGRLRAAGFSWQQTARETAASLQRALAER